MSILPSMNRQAFSRARDHALKVREASIIPKGSKCVRQVEFL